MIHGAVWVAGEWGFDWSQVFQSDIDADAYILTIAPTDVRPLGSNYRRRGFPLHENTIV